MATKTDLTNEFATVLRCQPKYVPARLIGLGHFDHCSRCGGCGQYSYCQSHGTTCFGCGGSGKKAPKLSKALLETVSLQADNGQLDAYIHKLTERARIARAAKQAHEAYFEAWGTNPAVAADKGKHWTDSSKMHGAVNVICSAVWDRVQELTAEHTTKKLWIRATKWHRENGYTIKSNKAAHAFDADARVVLWPFIEKALQVASNAQQLLEAEGFTEASFGEYAHANADLQALRDRVLAEFDEVGPTLAAAGYGAIE